MKTNLPEKTGFWTKVKNALLNADIFCLVTLLKTTPSQALSQRSSRSILNTVSPIIIPLFNFSAIDSPPSPALNNP